ncbi:MAG: hypothetical protein JWP87_1763 [Labilithrix sp.]|nr:hypothetical protein [Labilithrix sp.]
MTILRVGALAMLVGHGCTTQRSASDPRVALATPELTIPPLDAGTYAAPDAPGSVRFGHPVPGTGAAWDVSVRARSHSEDQESTYESDYRVEVLAVDGPAPSRVRLHFTRNVHVYQGQEKATVIDGREYVVDARAPHVRDANGNAAPEPETERVLDVFPDLGTRARIDEVLPDAAMKVGDRRDELAAAILRVIHPRAWTLGSGTALLADAGRDHARFAVTLDATSSSGLHMLLTGDANVRLRDSRLEELTLEGRYEQTTKGRTDPPGSFVLTRRITSESEARSAR